MFLKLDFFFVYKYVLRFLLIHKHGFFSNTFGIPFLNKIFIFFCISEVEDVDDVCFFNYPFLLRFFFGKRAFFTKFKSFFNLGRFFFSFHIFSFFNGRSCFFPIFFLVNDIKQLAIPNSFFVYSAANNCAFFYLSFSDLNLFLEKKTNIGLYNLRHRLYCKFYFSCSDFFSSFMLFDLLKIF